MDNETDKIKEHIEFERVKLGRNLNEIEYRVKNATDPKTQFDKNTGLILGAAVAGGFLLSLAFPKRSRFPQSWEAEPQNIGRGRAEAPSKHWQQVSETLDNVVEGIIAVASGEIVSFVAQAIPGFQAQFDAIGRQGGREPFSNMKRSPDSPLSAVK
jgi:hypothetical protein